MSWIVSPSNNSSDSKADQSLNGPCLFPAGAFYIQYGSMTLGNSTTETSIFHNQASATANTASIPSSGALTLASQPGDKWPGSTLALFGPLGPGTMMNPYGALTLGTTLNVRMFGSIKNNSSTPTLAWKGVLRNAVTGAVAYTLWTQTVTMVSTATATGLCLDATFCVTAGGSAGTIVATPSMTSTGWTATTTAAAPTVTTVNCTASYILDSSLTWGTAHANNTLTLYNGYVQLIG